MPDVTYPFSMAFMIFLAFHISLQNSMLSSALGITSSFLTLPLGFGKNVSDPGGSCCFTSILTLSNQSLF